MFRRIKEFSGKVILVKKNRITTIAVIAAAAVLFGMIYSPAVVGAEATKRLLPIYSVERDGKMASMTFDAAWGNEDTQEIIDILGKYGVRATFFVVGEWVEKYPESVKSLSDAGHEVMNHSDDHAHFSKLSPSGIISNVKACNDKIEAVTGVRPTLFRAPFGEYDDKVVGTLSSMEMNTIQWDVDSLDWKDLSATEITKRVTSRVRPGSIILFHNAALHTPEALPDIIEYMIQNGFALVPVSELILKGDYTIDHTGRQLAKKSGAG